MGWLAVLLLLALILGGAGFAIHVLWWIAVIMVVILLVGFLTPRGGGRWYRW